MPDSGSPKARVLVADDDPAFRDAFRQMLEMRGLEVETVGETGAVAEKLTEKQFDVLTLDLNWEQETIDGLSVLQMVRRLDPLLPILMVTGQATIPTAIEATRMGAFDYIEKIQDREKTLLTIKNAIEAGRLRRANEMFINELKAKHRLIGKSAAMTRLRQEIDQVGPADSTVLITGQSGTGKELVARQIHYASRRRDKAFVSVDAGTVSDDLAESELFGHRRGAFTGAMYDHAGLVNEAEGGTLFLDEISNASPAIQTKFLHLLQEREYRRVGETATRRADVRVIAASNRDLPELVRENKFREDLFYRLNVIAITIPPLAERREDIPLLASHFVKAKSLLCCGREKSITLDAVNVLVDRAWPGNIRELENAIERAVILTGPDVIEREDIVRVLGGGEPRPTDSALRTLNAMTNDFRRQCVIKALNLTNGKVQEAATLLDIDRSHLYRLIKEYDLKNMSE